MDSIADIRIYAQDLPGYNINFGGGIAGVGDVNGDGVDDFVAGPSTTIYVGLCMCSLAQGRRQMPTNETAHGLPTTFLLADPYPNPFNATLSIPFTVNERQHVTIEVCNALGQKVAMLLDKEMPAGEQRVTWQAEGAPSGVYFVRMRGEVDGGQGERRGTCRPSEW